MKKENVIEYGKSLLQNDAYCQPLPSDKSVSKIKFFEYLSALDHPLITVQVIGDNDKSLWDYPGHPAESDGEDGYWHKRCNAVAEYLSALYNVPLEKCFYL